MKICWKQVKKKSLTCTSIFRSSAFVWDHTSSLSTSATLTTELQFGRAPPHLGSFKTFQPTAAAFHLVAFSPKDPPHAHPPHTHPSPPLLFPLSSRQTWQASLHCDFQSRPFLHQMLRGNIKHCRTEAAWDSSVVAG